MNKIYYNNKDVFSGICYTPFISYSLESDGHISAKESITLHGEIFTDCISGSSGIFLKQKNLLNNFLKNYAKLSVLENSKEIYSCSNAIIKSIDFEESNYAYALPFSIEIDCYEKDFFSGAYGVYDIENVFDLKEQENQVVEISHKISAKGFNNENSAIYNALNWVHLNSGLASMPTSAFINMANGNTPILSQVAEKINRFEGTVSIEENYIFDQAMLGNGLVRYTADINVDKKNFNTISLRGQIFMGIYGNINAAKDRYKSIDWYSEAAHIYRKSTYLNDLSAIPVKYSVKEKIVENLLEFEIIYNNDNSPLIKVETSASFDNGLSVSKSVSTASIKSKITSRSGIITERYKNVLDYFKNNFNPVQEFIKNMPSSIINYDFGNFKLIDDSVKFSEKNGEIEYSCVWSVNKINKYLPCYIKSISMDLETGPEISDYNFVQVLCADYLAFVKGKKWRYNKVGGQMSVYPGYETSALDWAFSLLGAGRLALHTSSKSTNGNINFEYKNDFY